MSAKSEKKTCTCCQNCSGHHFSDFQKVVELKELGITLYRYVLYPRSFRRSCKVGEAGTRTVDSNDIFILHNNNYKKASTEDCLLALDSNPIHCLRCRQIAQRAQKLLHRGENIIGKCVKSICEHCLTRQAHLEYRQSCFECQNIAKKFAAAIAIKSAFHTALGPSIERRGRYENKIRPGSYINVITEDLALAFKNALQKPKEVKLKAIENLPPLSPLFLQKLNSAAEHELCAMAPDAEQLSKPLARSREEAKMIKIPISETLKETCHKKHPLYADSSNIYDLYQEPKIHVDPRIATSSELITDLGVLFKKVLEKAIQVQLEAKENLQPLSDPFRQKLDLAAQHKLGMMEPDKQELGKLLKLLQEEAKNIEVPISETKIRPRSRINEITEDLAILIKNALQKVKEVELKSKENLPLFLQKLNSAVEHELYAMAPDEKKKSKPLSRPENVIKTKIPISETLKDTFNKKHPLYADSQNLYDFYQESKIYVRPCIPTSSELITHIKEKEAKKQELVQRDKKQKESAETTRKKSNYPVTQQKVSTTSIASLKKNSLLERPIKDKDKTQKSKQLSKKKNTQTKLKHTEDVKDIETAEQKYDKEKLDKDIVEKSKQPTKKDLQEKSIFTENGKEEETAEQIADREYEEKMAKAQDILKVSAKLYRDLEKKNERQRIKKEQANNKIDKEEDNILEKPAVENIDEVVNNLNKVLLKQDKKEKKAMRIREKLKEREDTFREKAGKKLSAPVGSYEELPKISYTLKPQHSAGTVVKQATGEEYLQLPFKSIRLKEPSFDNLIIKLLNTRQMKFGKKDREAQATKQLEATIAKKTLKQKYKYGEYVSDDLYSDYNIDIQSLLEGEKEENRDIIVGNTIFNPTEAAHYWATKKMESGLLPSIFKTKFDEPPLEDTVQVTETVLVTPDKRSRSNDLKLQTTESKMVGTGVLRYKLSDKNFIEKGWTSLPSQKTFRKVNLYRMHPARPEFDWFKHNRKKGYLLYDTGELLATFDDSGHGSWYYRNGKIALDFYDAEELNSKQRIVIYSKGEPEGGRRRPVTVLGSFDYIGNGIILDHSGNERLKYNQAEGVILDKTIGPSSHWKWHDLNDPPKYQQMWIEEQEKYVDPAIKKIIRLNENKDDKCKKQKEGEDLDVNEEIRNNYLKEMLNAQHKATSGHEFKPFKIRMKAVKISDHFSLRVIDQSNIYILFRDGTTNLKLNVGMNLDPFEIVDMEYLEVKTDFESHLNKFPALTKSIENLQLNIARANNTEARYKRYDKWLRPNVPSDPADQVATNFLSRPLKSTFLTTAIPKCNCN